MTLELINHKQPFPPTGNDTSAMLIKIAKTSPNYAFVIEWPKNGSMPVLHTTTEDAPILAFRLQNFLNDLYAGKYPKLFVESK